MMYHLTQDQLAHIIFPLGRTHKTDTRKIAREKGLPVYNRPESQDICFLGQGKLTWIIWRSMLRKYSAPEIL